MSHVKEWGVGFEPLADPYEVTIDSTVPVGHTIFVACVGRSNASNTLDMFDEVTDSKGNIYTNDHTIQTSSVGTSILLSHCVLETQLVSGDKISIAPQAGQDRFVMTVHQFSDEVTGRDSTDQFVPLVYEKDLSAGSVSSSDTSALYIAAWALENKGRVFTAGNGWTAGAKYISESGASGDRAVLFQWRYGSGAVDADGSLNAAGNWAGVSAAFGLDTVAPSVGLGSVIVGGAKKTVGTMSVIVGGAKKPVTSVSVIVGGAKKPLSG